MKRKISTSWYEIYTYVNIYSDYYTDCGLARSSIFLNLHAEITNDNFMEGYADVAVTSVLLSSSSSYHRMTSMLRIDNRGITMDMSSLSSNAMEKPNFTFATTWNVELNTKPGQRISCILILDTSSLFSTFIFNFS